MASSPAWEISRLEVLGSGAVPLRNCSRAFPALPNVLALLVALPSFLDVFGMEQSPQAKPANLESASEVVSPAQEIDARFVEPPIAGSLRPASIRWHPGFLKEPKLVVLQPGMWG